MLCTDPNIYKNAPGKGLIYEDEGNTQLIKYYDADLGRIIKR